MLMISENVRDALVAYLQEKPFKEVANGIRALQNLEPVDLNSSCSDNKPKKEKEEDSWDGVEPKAVKAKKK